MIPHRLLTLAMAAGVSLMMGPLQAADTWPPDQVNIVVPYPPGSEPDTLARDVGNALSQRTGSTFVVENRPGANAMIGTGYVARGPADGSVLLMVDRLSLVTNPLLYDNVPYEWQEDLKPVTDFAAVNLYVAVNSELPIENYEDLIEYARVHPGELNVGTGGNGHVTHIGMEMLARAEGVEFSYIPYKGISPAMVDTVGGQIDAVMAGGLMMATHRANGGIRVLVVGADEREAFMDDVPTLAEAGGQPGTIPSTYFSLFAPASVPDEVIATMHDEIAEVLANPKLRSNYEARGLIVAPNDPQSMMATMLSDQENYSRLIEEAGITVN